MSDLKYYNGVEWVPVIAGAQGTSGTQGPSGAQGVDGAYAAQGIQGRQGTQGIQGYLGLTGAQGTQGVQGLLGTQALLYTGATPPSTTSVLWADTSVTNPTINQSQVLGLTDALNAKASTTSLDLKANITSPALQGTPTTPTALADTNTTQIASTAFVLGQASVNTPPMDGTASYGSGYKYARENHVHPSDTSRSPVAGSSSLVTTGTVTTGEWNANFTNQTSLRNILHNGGLNVWQRGTSSFSITSSTPTYTADRWFVYSTNVVSVTPTMSSNHVTKVVFSSAATNNNSTYLVQRIEAVNSWHLAGKTVTVSATITGGSSTVPPSVAIYKNNVTSDDTWDDFPTSSNKTALSLVGSSTFTYTTPSTTATRMSATFTVPSTALYGLELVIDVGSLNGVTTTIEQIQLEVGSVATPFERRPYSLELSLCQPYYTRINANGTNGSLIGTATAINTTSTTSANAFIPLPVTMRKTPTSIDQSGTFRLHDGVNPITVSSVALNTNRINSNFATVSITASSALAAVRPYMFDGGTSGTAYLGFSADL